MSLPEYTGDSIAFYAAMAEDNLQREIAERAAERRRLAEAEPRYVAKVEKGMASSATQSTVVVTRREHAQAA